MKKILSLLLVLIIAVTSCSGGLNYGDAYIDAADLPEYTGQRYVKLGQPGFSDEALDRGDFEEYSPLDELGRCGQAFALITPDTMPDGERDNISGIKPSGWHTVRYDDLIEDKYLYNRSHLIAFSLAGESANEENLITGTRYFNQELMLPWEEKVLFYVRRTGNSVLYRVTPIFEGDNLLATGVQMEAYSVEDDGRGVCYNVFIFNVQPGVGIDYETGDSWRESALYEGDTQGDYILNTNSKKIHYAHCEGATAISPKNRAEYSGSRQKLIDKGYEPCGRCNP